MLHFFQIITIRQLQYRRDNLCHLPILPICRVPLLPIQISDLDRFCRKAGSGRPIQISRSPEVLPKAGNLCVSVVQTFLKFEVFGQKLRIKP